MQPELDDISLESTTNQQPPKPLKKAPPHKHIPPPTGRARNTQHYCAIIGSTQEAHSVSRTASSPPPLLRDSQSHSRTLWNPINSSAITSTKAASLPNDHVKAVALHGQGFGLNECYKLSPLRLKHARSSRPKRSNSLRVEVSHSSNSTYPQSHPLSSGLPQTPSGQNPAPFREATTMSPQPSLHSDTPSKRPPTPAKDLEYGHPNPSLPQPRSRTPSRRSQRASSTKSDIPWNPTHPCYPHPNPHIPLASPLHDATRIIRIPRDWMVAGDLAPTFSNTYPEILGNWVSEADFRTMIKTINEGLVAAFSPFGWRAWLDAILGVATGWIWEDLGFAAVKARLRSVEQTIEDWNGQKKGTMEKDEDVELVRIIPLRRTGYLSLDIQIPDPHVGMVEDEEGNDREGRAIEAEEQRKL